MTPSGLPVCAKTAKRSPRNQEPCCSCRLNEGKPCCKCGEAPAPDSGPISVNTLDLVTKATSGGLGSELQVDLEESTDPKQQLYDIATMLRLAVHDIQHYLAEPAAPDAEIQAWPLWTGEDGGGVWCGDQDCPLEAENSRILYDGDFTLPELHEAIGEHIAARREREEDL